MPFRPDSPHLFRREFPERKSQVTMKQQIPEDIATDEGKLKAKVQEMLGDGATIDSQTTGRGGYENAPSDVSGVLVKTRGDAGAVRTTGISSEDENIETGPLIKSRYYLLVVKEGQSCALLGKPSVRLIRRG